MTAHPSISRRVMIAAAALAAVALMLLVPLRAQATYADIDSDNPARQDLKIWGDVLYASDIPEGTYTVPVSTSSYMCLMSNPSTGARNECQITVSGGAIWATFTLSNAYNAIYMGTAEEAASLTNEDGTDGSEYLFGTPVGEDYVPHTFTVQVPYLGKAFAMATFNGASTTRPFSARQWYSREVAVIAGKEVTDAVENGGEEPDPVHGGGNGGSENGQQVDNGENANDGQEEADARDDVKKDEKPAAALPTGRSGGTGSGSGSGSGGGTTPGGTEAGGSGSGSGGSGSGGSGGSTLRGIPFSIATLENVEVEVGDAKPVEAEEERPFELPIQAIVGIGAAALAVGGLAWRIVRFRQELSGGPDE